MRRRLLIVLLSLTAIGGFVHGCASVACWHGHGRFGHHARMRRFEDHVAEVCLRAAERGAEARPAPPAKP
jgi:hypothetical protein